MTDAGQGRMQKVLAKEGGIFLDIGCGMNKEKRAIGMDILPWPGVDIVHDIEDLPWPVEDASCYRVLASHILEHIQPNKILWVIAECHRVLKTHGQLMIAMPYGAYPRALQDPTHYRCWIESCAQYFDCNHQLWCSYREIYGYRGVTVPCFKIELSQWTAMGDLNIIMAKRAEDNHGEYHHWLGKVGQGPED